MATVFICLVNSAYYEDSLSHVDSVYDSKGKAQDWKEWYEGEMRKNGGFIVSPPKNGEDSELDRYIEDKKTVEIATKFISAEIREFKVL